MKLPPKYRTVIYLYYYEGYKTEEIGRMLKLREVSVRTALSRGRAKLKNKITEGGCSIVYNKLFEKITVSPNLKKKTFERIENNMKKKRKIRVGSRRN